MTSSLPTDFTRRELYGGAISAHLPSRYIDASDLRQIPDHQELFLSDTTLNSIIFELNQYQHDSTVSSPAHSDTRRPSFMLAIDQRASIHHWLDPLSRTDVNDPDNVGMIIDQVTMAHPSLHAFPAYLQRGTIESEEPEQHQSQQGSGRNGILPNDWVTPDSPRSLSSPGGSRRHLHTRAYQLLVRLRPYGTDLCVRVNVPLKELVRGDGDDGDGNHDARVEAEEQVAESIINNLIQTLAVHDFGLFAAEEEEENESVILID